MILSFSLVLMKAYAGYKNLNERKMVSLSFTGDLMSETVCTRHLKTRRTLRLVNCGKDCYQGQRRAGRGRWGEWTTTLNS